MNKCADNDNSCTYVWYKLEDGTEVKRNKRKKKRNPNYIWSALKTAYTETRLDEYLRTGIPSRMTFTNFLVMYMNYPYEEATKITECYRKWEHRFKK